MTTALGRGSRLLVSIYSGVVLLATHVHGAPWLGMSESNYWVEVTVRSMTAAWRSTISNMAILKIQLRALRNEALISCIVEIINELRYRRSASVWFLGDLMDSLD